jgi:hypothetical protein
LQAYKTAIVHDTLKLCDRFHKAVYRFLVDFLWYQCTFAKRTEVALHTHSFLSGLRQEQVAIMVQERSLVEMALIGL